MKNIKSILWTFAMGFLLFFCTTLSEIHNISCFWKEQEKRITDEADELSTKVVNLRADLEDLRSIQNAEKDANRIVNSMQMQDDQEILRLLKELKLSIMPAAFKGQITP